MPQSTPLGLGALLLALGHSHPTSPHQAWVSDVRDLALTKELVCGPATGSWATIPDGNRVAVWHSLPYGEPPVGEKRWRAPQAAACWEGDFDARSWKQGGYCVQSHLPVSGTEDCLYLHVHVPEGVANGSAAEKVPVLVYIHGGGLMDGGGQFEHVDPFVSHAGPEGVIVVTINYRLNIFGWLVVEELSQENGGTSGNYGLLDQQLALRWVKANAAAFGGDPARVTVAGQSSGGTSIFALLGSPASVGLFEAAIALSGSINTSMSLAQGHAQNAPIVAATGCGAGATATERLACLRALQAADLVAAVPESWNTPGMWGLELLDKGGMGYQGLPVVDGAVVTHSFQDALAEGLVDVPLMFGNMAFESDLDPDVDVAAYDQAQWEAHLNASVASWAPTFSSIGADLYAEYRNASLADPDKAYTALNTDYGLTCGSAAIAVGAKAGAYTSPVYLFVGRWGPEAPIPRDGRRVTYAYHEWDYQVAIENWAEIAGEEWGQPGGWAPGPRDQALSQALQGLWFDLMDDGALGPDSGWASVDDVAGFPAHYITYVFAPPGGAAGGSGSVVDFRAGSCGLLAGWGFDARFWWCN